jgi:two-component system, chemotaxis family, chemotaxis protein CheY
MDGIALVREVRKMASLRFIPVLMVTTESQQAKRMEAKAAGATGWLVKPVQPEALLQVIRQVVPGA